MTTAKRLILLLAVPLLAFLGLGVFTRLEPSEVLTRTDQGRRDEAVAHLDASLADVGGRQLHEASRALIRLEESQAAGAGQHALASIDGFRGRMAAANTTALVLTSLLGLLTFRRIVRPIHALPTSVQSPAGDDYAQDVPFTESADETGRLARAVDVLKAGAAARAEQRWIKANTSTLTGELQRASSLPKFGERLLSSLVPLPGGGVAAFYAFDDTTGVSRRLAAYGLAPDPNTQDRFARGEGLVGQRAQDRKRLTLSGLPPNYSRIVELKWQINELATSRGRETPFPSAEQGDATAPCDIFFMDWRMPGLDGLQASRHIKSDETLHHDPAIVLVTAS